MTRTALLAITAVSAIATPFVVNATVAKAPVETTAPALVEAAPAITAEEPSCMRRVRVVYQGYAGNGCVVASK